MDLIIGYSDDEGGGARASPPAGAAPPPKLLDVAVSAAPEVDTTGLALVENQAVAVGDAVHLMPASARAVAYNLPLEQMHAPVVGPAHPSQRGGVGAAALRNHRTGHVELANLSSFAFDEQFHTFESMGYAADPAGAGVVKHRDVSSAGDRSVFVNAPKRQKTDKGAAKEQAQQQQQEQQPFDPTQPFTLTARQPWAEKETVQAELTEEQKEYIAQMKAKKAEKEAEEGVAESSIFHGKAETDYQGRSWVEPPREQRREPEACFLPKRHVHSWSGHTKGVNACRFFPQLGHLLLSAGLDGKVKIWDVVRDKRCMRTYLGHSKGVRDIWFANDGRRFVSTGYDRIVRCWDTETGKVLGSYGSGKMCYTVRLHPEEQHVLMAGTQDKKILQWDMNTGELVQEYDYHLGAVNTVTFIDNNRRFVSTSDDKTIRMWEFGIQAQAKYIADPSMHAISSAVLSPNGKWWLGQSMDNQIVTYSADRLKPIKKKTFKGHTVAGYACQVNLSHDGRYVISGDGEGKLYVWDWKTAKILRSLKAHEGVCMGAEWHPLDSSKVATCGWDGLVKLWD